MIDSSAGSQSAGQTALGLGSIATQSAASVAITGGSVSGITDLAVADGGTGASTATAARTNLGFGSAMDARRNRIVNGGMMISQENGTTAASTDGYYPVDQFAYVKSHDGTVSVAQVASTTPGGSPNRLRATVSGTDTSIAAGQYAYLTQKIEGQMVADFRYGGASATAAILRFGIKAPAGTYCVSLTNSANNRSFVSEVVIALGEANTDVVKTVAITGDATGTWLTDTGIGLQVRWCLAAGSTYQGATGWSAGNFLCTSNQSNFLGTNAQVFELFDVGLYLDPDGSGVPPPWELPDYGETLRGCRRYWRQGFLKGAAYATTGAVMFADFDEMRDVPTVALTSNINVEGTGTIAGSITNTTSSTKSSVRVQVSYSATGSAGAPVDASCIFDVRL